MRFPSEDQIVAAGIAVGTATTIARLVLSDAIIAIFEIVKLWKDKRST